MAERKRRGDDAVDERLDDALDEELDDEASAFEDEDDFDDEDDRAAVATKSRPAKSRAAKSAKSTVRTREPERVGFFGRIRNFVREVVAELRKVIWPTRKELLTYTAVVIVFVTIMFTIVAGLDYGFTKAMFWVFGNVKHK